MEVHEVTNTRLGKIVANLKLKELEIIEKISDNIPRGSKILRTLISPNQHNFIAVNGDWEEVLGYTEDECRENDWSLIMPDYEVSRCREVINKLKDVKDGFTEFTCDVLTKSGQVLKASWKSKYYPDLNLVISIGRLV